MLQGLAATLQTIGTTFQRMTVSTDCRVFAACAACSSSSAQAELPKTASAIRTADTLFNIISSSLNQNNFMLDVTPPIDLADRQVSRQDTGSRQNNASESPLANLQYKGASTELGGSIFDTRPVNSDCSLLDHPKRL